MNDKLMMTPSEVELLTAVVVDAVRVSPKAQTVDAKLFFELLVLRDKPASAKAEYRELLTVVATIPALDIFNTARQCALGHEEHVDLRFLVGWLISRGQQVGAAEAVSDLARYLTAETIELQEILAIDGLNVAGSLQLGEYELIAWDQLPMTDSKWRVVVQAHFEGATPTAALLRRHRVQPVHARPWDGLGTYQGRVSLEPAWDLLRCATASLGAGIRFIHYWFEPDEWAPWAVQRSGFGVDSTSIAWPVVLDESNAPTLLICAERIMALQEEDRSRLRVPLDRLNRSYLTRMRSVDVAIELGIALESLYAPSKLSEGIAYAVRTRAARFLGGSLQDRQAVVKVLKDVYDLRSRAVHAGRFDAADGPKKWRDEVCVRAALEEGQSLIGRSLVKIIEEGEPNWEDFDIGPVDSSQGGNEGGPTTDPVAGAHGASAEARP